MSFAERNLRTREIFTKAVCGRGRKFLTIVHRLTPPQRPDSILGAWIINPKYEAVRSEDGVDVVGSYDCNVWYAYEDNTKTDVAKETVTFRETVPLTYYDANRRLQSEQVSAEATQEPHCVEATVSVDGQQLILHVEQEYRVELTAETKLSVVVADGADEFEDKGFELSSVEEHDYDELDPNWAEDDIDLDDQ